MIVGCHSTCHIRNLDNSIFAKFWYISLSRTLSRVIDFMWKFRFQCFPSCLKKHFLWSELFLLFHCALIIRDWMYFSFSFFFQVFRTFSYDLRFLFSRGEMSPMLDNAPILNSFLSATSFFSQGFCLTFTAFLLLTTYIRCLKKI